MPSSERANDEVREYYERFNGWVDWLRENTDGLSIVEMREFAVRQAVYHRGAPNVSDNQVDRRDGSTA